MPDPGPGEPNILLMGLRYSGKSTLGRALADALGRPFFDLDDLTPRVLGFATVRDAWEARGQVAFRAAEHDALTRALSGRSRVIALGGGTPTAPGAVDILQAARRERIARVVYLRASATTLRRRMERDTGVVRPSLTGADPGVEIEAVLAARDLLYLDLSDHVLNMDALEAEGAVDALLGLLGRPRA